VWFYLDQGGGRHVRGWLLREASELAAWGVAEGMPFGLDLPEQGAVGRAWAWKVEPVRVPGGPGRLVTGWFCHSEGQAYDLRVEGEPVPIGVTALHPVYAPDRRRYVPAIELRPGERLLAEDGTTPKVESLTLRAGPEPVYNIEVEGDHCYRVGQQGLLVHNASAGCDPCADAMLRAGQRVITPRKEVTIPNAPRFNQPTGWRPMLPTDALGRSPSEQAITARRSVTVTIVKQVLTNLRLSDTGEDPSPTLRWVISGEDNPNRLGVWNANARLRDTAGHIIGSQFGGKASETNWGRENLFPQNAGVNDRQYAPFENSLAALIRSGHRVCIRITFIFGDQTLPERPQRFEVEWWDNGTAHTQPFDNPRINLRSGMLPSGFTP
jgi:hypothetical protein